MIKIVLKCVYINNAVFKNNRTDKKRISELRWSNAIKLYWCEDGCDFKTGPDKQVYCSIRYGTRNDIFDLMTYFGNNKIGPNTLTYNFDILNFFNRHKTIKSLRKAIGRKSGRLGGEERKRLEHKFENMLGDIFFLIFRTKSERYEAKNWVFETTKKLISDLDAKSEEDIEKWIQERYGTWIIEKYRDYIETRDELWLDPEFEKYTFRYNSENTETSKLKVTMTSPFLKTPKQKRAGIMYMSWQLRWYYFLAGPEKCKELGYIPKKISDWIEEQNKKDRI